MGRTFTTSLPWCVQMLSNTIRVFNWNLEDSLFCPYHCWHSGLLSSHHLWHPCSLHLQTFPGQVKSQPQTHFSVPVFYARLSSLSHRSDRINLKGGKIYLDHGFRDFTRGLLALLFLGCSRQNIMAGSSGGAKQLTPWQKAWQEGARDKVCVFSVHPHHHIQWPTSSSWGPNL
jgi:hypothetical protein